MATKAFDEYLAGFNKPIPQSAQADPAQVPNNAGGYTFVTSDKTRLLRFLMIGTTGGTFYVAEKDLTKQNLDWLIELIKRDELLVAEVVRMVSSEGRAYRNSPAIMACAFLLKYAQNKANARYVVRVVCRTSTHLFELGKYIEFLGGWGRSKRQAVAEWYLDKTPESLAYQVVKYRQRDGWTHRDLLRLSHPVGVDKAVGDFILGNEDITGEIPEIITGFIMAQSAESVKELLFVLGQFSTLPWEAIPTKFHKEPEVWKKLFANGQLKGQALVRNVTRLARIGAFDDMVFAREYANALVDEEMIKRTKLHPIQYLNALLVHSLGQVNRTGGYFYSYDVPRTKDWTTSPVIKDALQEGFYKSFGAVEPSRKRTLIALDVSGSMSSPASGLDMSCAQVAAAMAMVTARTEPYYNIRGFSDGTPSGGKPVFVNSASYNRSVLADLGISPSMSLEDVMQKTADQNFGRTDCALPMVWALQNKVEIDTFVIWTDNETWYGSIHPHKALEQYRQKMDIDAKLVVCAMTATDISIADPNDRGQLDIVGVDANVARLISDFSAGNI